MLDTPLTGLDEKFERIERLVLRIDSMLHEVRMTMAKAATLAVIRADLVDINRIVSLQLTRRQLVVTCAFVCGLGALVAFALVKAPYP